MNKKTGITFLVVIFLGLFGLAKNSLAAGITLPWSTSFNGCSSDLAITSLGSYYACGLDNNGQANTWSIPNLNLNPSGYYQGVYAADNNPSGGGGRGVRRYIYDGGITCDTCADGYLGRVSLNTPQHELWIRFYARWQNGFQWYSFSHPEKMIYLYGSGTSGILTIGPNSVTYTIGVGGGSGIQPSSYVCGQSAGQNIYPNQVSCSTTGWNQMFASAPTHTDAFGNQMHDSDGSWHYFEIHTKLNSVGAYDGVLDVWQDGQLISHYTTVSFIGTTAGWDNFSFFVNQGIVYGSGPFYEDIDDIAIGNTGYIGSLNSAPDTTPPAAPSGLSVS